MREKNGESGVLTMEAAILMPIFIMLMLALDGLVLFFMGQQIMLHAAVQTAKSMSFDPYANGRIGADSDDYLADMFVDIFGFVGGDFSGSGDWTDDPSDIADTARERFTAYLRRDSSSGTYLLDQVGINGGIESLDFSGSKVEDGYLVLSVKYTQDFAINLMDLTSFDREISLKTKLFVWK